MPVVKVWDRIIMVPLIGMLDSERTQMMMEILLEALENLQAKVAILDISGIPVVDTLVARHLITAASAAKLMGAECIITGVRARIAQTLVQLGIDLGGIVTCTAMADGLQLALEMTDQKIREMKNTDIPFFKMAFSVQKNIPISKTVYLQISFP
ncbi:MAG: STAS domain-containing protein [Desulfobacteraceae bacterium]|nr:STAS domain-containing protein [Desulfobacteraceae bacterium]